MKTDMIVAASRPDDALLLHTVLVGEATQVTAKNEGGKAEKDESHGDGEW